MPGMSEKSHKRDSDPPLDRLPVVGVRFRLAGIPVVVEPVFVVTAALIGFLGREGILALWLVASVFVSVFVHEIGHALAFRAFGRSPAIVLHGLGGRTSASGVALSRGRDLLVSVAGSATQILVLGVPAWLLREPLASRTRSFTVYAALDDLAWVSLAWGLLNLAPVLPLDGGRIATRLLEIVRKDALRIAHGISVAVAAGASAWAFARGDQFLGIGGVMLAGFNLRSLSEQRDAPMRDRIRDGHRLIDAGDAAGALAVAEEAATARSPAVRHAALELVAWAHLARGDRGAADNALARRAAGSERSDALAGYLALDDDRDAAMIVVERAYLDASRWPPNRLLAARLARDGLAGVVAERLLASPDAAGRLGADRLADEIHATGPKG